MKVVEVEDLRVELVAGGHDVIDDVSFSIGAGEILGLVGETGSGKTTVAHALLGHARRGARIARGAVRISGENILGLSNEQLRRRRGRIVSYVPQDPPAALNPGLPIRRQLEELLQFHEAGTTPEVIHGRTVAALAEVSLPTTDEFLNRYPHQLSGGQMQRVVLAMAFLLRPTLVVLDEPTTGLDVTTQAEVLKVARSLCDDHDVAGVYVSHDLAVVSQIASRTMVMYCGRISEIGPSPRVFASPAHPYTRRLVRATPDPASRRVLASIAGVAARPGERPSGCPFHPRCTHAVDACSTSDLEPVEVSDAHLSWCLRTHELPASEPNHLQVEDNAGEAATEEVLRIDSLSAFYEQQAVVDSVSLVVYERECVALVGESGSGKTTLARCIIGLHTSHTGRMIYRGTELQANARDRPAALRRRMQYIFQSPFSSLNPRQVAGDIVAVPIRLFFKVNRREARRRAIETLERVGLPAGTSERYPQELSGGERQRVAIARALACEPEVLICDEITSALDVSVQAAIIDLLMRMQREEGLSMLFITHNLALVRALADRVVILNRARVVEAGRTERVLDEPTHAYTQRLLSDTPTLPGHTMRPPVAR